MTKLLSVAILVEEVPMRHTLSTICSKRSVLTCPLPPPRKEGIPSHRIWRALSETSHENRGGVMKSTPCMALMLTIVSGLLVSCATAPTSRSEREVLLAEAASALKRMNAEDPGVNALVRRGYGYALFPTVTKGGLVVGGAHGQGVLYEQGRHTAYCDLTQATVGLQAGAQTFSELLVFEGKAALDRFKSGQLTFAADASAV